MCQDHFADVDWDCHSCQLSLPGGVDKDHGDAKAEDLIAEAVICGPAVARDRLRIPKPTSCYTSSNAPQRRDVSTPGSATYMRPSARMLSWPRGFGRASVRCGRSSWSGRMRRKKAAAMSGGNRRNPRCCRRNWFRRLTACLRCCSIRPSGLNSADG